MGSMRLTLLCLVAMGWMIAGGGRPRTTSLTELRDHRRVLLVFAASSDDAKYKAQIADLEAHAAESEERDLSWVELPFRGEPEGAIRLADPDSARRRFKVAQDEFVVVLVGKDGGEKLRSSTPVDFERLRATIDAMPMRQDEMRDKH